MPSLFEAMTFGGSYAGDRPDFSITATQIALTAFASSQNLHLNGCQVISPTSSLITNRSHHRKKLDGWKMMGRFLFGRLGLFRFREGRDPRGCMIAVFAAEEKLF